MADQETFFFPSAESIVKHQDVIIVGAGLSGIAAAYHLQDKCPERSYAILEARDAIGGTWDLFKYPGIRSDSDMYTLGYSFRPWTSEKALADGAAILEYIRDTASDFGIEERIQFGRKVVAASWDSGSSRWTITSEDSVSGETEEMTCDFFFMCSGYYDYDEGYTPDFEGIGDFKGEIVHPQKWDESTKYAGKKVVVIGSGATAVTLVPSIADEAESVTMLQRSPTYVLSLPAIDEIAQNLQSKLPETLAYHTIRWKNILVSMGLFHFCRRFPKLARQVITAGVRKEVGDVVDVDTHFNPWYNPWDQRLCLVPNADLFKSLKAGKAAIVTDHIKRFTEEGIELESGQHLNADLIVTATGLRLKFLAGIDLMVDGETVRPADALPYKGVMFEGVPNMAMAFGYTNASWTLKCELACKFVCRMLNYMDENGLDVVVPTVEGEVEEIPLVDMTSGYFKRGEAQLPNQGSRSPWKVHQNYFKDLVSLKLKPVNDEGLAFRKA